jgi:hypothetical protein
MLLFPLAICLGTSSANDAIREAMSAESATKASLCMCISRNQNRHTGLFPPIDQKDGHPINERIFSLAFIIAQATCSTSTHKYSIASCVFSSRWVILHGGFWDGKVRLGRVLLGLGRRKRLVKVVVGRLDVLLGSLHDAAGERLQMMQVIGTRNMTLMQNKGFEVKPASLPQLCSVHFNCGLVAKKHDARMRWVMHKCPVPILRHRIALHPLRLVVKLENTPGNSDRPQNDSTVEAHQQLPLNMQRKMYVWGQRDRGRMGMEPDGGSWPS